MPDYLHGRAESVVKLVTGLDALGLVVEGSSEGLAAAIKPEHAARLERLIARTQRLVEKHWPQVEVVAEALIEFRTMSGEEVEQLVASHQPQPFPVGD